jgi:hypothetical protein
MTDWDFDLYELDREKCPVCRARYQTHDLNGMFACQKIATDFTRDFVLPIKENKNIDHFAVARKTWQAFLKAFPKYKHRNLTTPEKIHDAH